MRKREFAIGRKDRLPIGAVRRAAAIAMAVLATALTLVPNLAGAQVAGLGVGVTPAFDSPVTVGEQDQPALIQLVNNSFGPQAGVDTVTLTNLQINTSCAVSAVDPVGPSPCPTPEPRPNPALPVLDLDAASTAGTTCPGGPFTITGPDAEGDYTFTPTGGPLTLAGVGQPGSSCVITFTFDVIQRPNDGATFQTARVLASSPTFPGGSPQTGVSLVTVNQATPSLETLVSVPGGGPVPVGTSFTDTATVTGVANGPTPTGTVSFTVFQDPPGAAPCSGTATNLGASPLTGPAPTPPTPPTSTATSAPVTANLPGTYRFVATYSGDVNYAPLGPTACDAPGENVTVTQLTATLVTQASTNATDVPPGTAVTDLATLTPPAGAPAPTGTVTYTLVGPNPDPACTGPVVGTSTVPVGSPSAPFNPTLPGTYNFVATYSGDAVYEPITTPVGCGDPNERFAIPRQPVQLTTQASTNSTTVMPGTVVTDTAIVTPPAGFPAPTGTVTYTLVGPNPNAGCTAPVVGAPSTVPVGSPSAGYTVTAPGTYNFVATYSGDANYLPITTPVGCGVPAEMFTVATLPIGLTTQASTNATNVAPGTPVTDLAVFTPPPGGPTPTGTVTYTLIGPNPNAGCTAPVFGTPSTVPVGTPSAPYAPTAPGTYNFVATYSGDANYSPITTPVGCGDPNEIFAIALQPITLQTQASTNSSTVAPGTAVTDIATFTVPAGAPAPTGTVTYTLVGPNPDAACTAPVVGSSTVAVGSPSAPFTVTAPGTYNFVATYSGDGFYAPITTPVGCNVPAERFAVALQPVQLATQASTNSTTVAPGSTVTDLATVTVPAGGPPATGTVTYTLVGPNPDAACTGPVVGTSTVPVGQASGPFTVTAVGTYNFVATYSGDANYLPITTPVGCGVPAEMFAVALRPIGLTTQASTNATNVAPGTVVTDVATLTPPAGAPAPTGTVTYTLVGPNPDAACTAPVVGTSTTPVGQPSGPFTVSAPGTYNFVATYSGDANYAAITTPVGCGDPNEIFAVALQPVNLVTQASTNAPNVTPGTTVTDLATLTPAPGGPAPTGTVTYTLVGPNPDPACTGPVVGTSTVPVGQPSGPFTVTTPGAYNFVATYSGDAFYSAITTPVGCNVPAERFTVTPAPINIVTQASPPVPVGGQVSDVATLSGGVNPTGTITFTLFGPDNTTCSGTPIFTSTVPVNGNGNYPSEPFTITAAGSYRWIAAYSGDANNAPAGPTACADPLELTAGLRVTPELVTVASAGSVGGQVFDTATLSNGFNPTGTITFQLFGPDDEDCSGPPIFTSVKPVNGNGNVVSDPFILPAPGIYHFVATYSGDANNNPVGPTACQDPNETVGVGRLPISLSTQASPSVPVGGQIFDTATIAGGFNPTGTIVFELYGPDNATCTGTPVFTSTVTVNGNGSYPSTSFTPTLPGTYRWIARYSGDANNAAAVTACDDPLEQVLVTPLPTIQVVKTASPESLPVPGGTFTFDVVVTNTSSVPLTIRTLTDNIYGDITTIPGSTCNTAIGTVLAPSPGPGNTYSCRFPGEFRGPGGASQTDIVTVTATDDRGNTVRDEDDAIVRITPVPPSIITTKTANPPSLQEPGGTFTFTFSVTNTGPEPVTVISLIDDVHGDLNGRGTCAIGARLAANGGTYTCTFTGNFFGNAGATQTDIITTTAVDDRGQQVTHQSRATVTITDVPPSIRIVKTPDPLSRPEPGGTFRFTLTITNPSFEPVTIISLVDDIYGDLNGRGSCAIGVTLAANGGTYSCSFDGDFFGNAGDSQTDTVTVVAVDDEGTQVTAEAKATVTLTPRSVPPVVQPPPPPPPPPPLPPAPKVLVRTGGDVGGPVRLAGMMLVVGMFLIAASWKFGPGAGGVLAYLPTGPRRGPGPGGPGSGGLGGGHWFGGPPARPPWSPRGGSGAGVLDRPRPAEPGPEPESGPEPPPADDLPWDEWVVSRSRPTPPASVAVTWRPAPDPLPVPVEPEVRAPEPV
ncbi:MAG: hypothetical protein ACRD1D_10080, partial [Acidimicrobiales bacterium]